MLKYTFESSVAFCVLYEVLYDRQKNVSGIDTTSCQAERNFFALELVVSDLRSRMSLVRVELTLFLRLNKHTYNPGPNKVLVSLHGLKEEERKVNADAAVAEANSVLGDKSSPDIFVVEYGKQRSRSVCVLRSALVVQRQLVNKLM